MLSRSSLRTRPLPGFIAPCLQTLQGHVPAGPMWAHEIKHDGYRFICRRSGSQVHAFTRRGHEWSDRVPAIAEALRSLPVSSVTLDGEAVICGPDGISDFDRLRGALAGRRARDAFLYAFDILELDGQDLRLRPWASRREALADLLRGSPAGIQLSEHMAGQHGPAMYRHACAMGLEGIVSKRVDRPYRSGRSPDWIKVKNPAAPAALRFLE